MKPTRPSVNLIVILSIATIAVLMLSQRKPAAPTLSKETAYLANPTSPEPPEVESKDLGTSSRPPTPAVVPAAASAATAVTASETSGPNVASEAEIAYQLGEDISKMTPEAKARLLADWEAHRQQAQDEAGVLQ